jgi:hypothetical protein
LLHEELRRFWTSGFVAFVAYDPDVFVVILPFFVRLVFFVVANLVAALRPRLSLCRARFGRHRHRGVGANFRS